MKCLVVGGVFVKLGRSYLRCGFGIDNGGQRFVIDVYQFKGILGLGFVLEDEVELAGEPFRKYRLRAHLSRGSPEGRGLDGPAGDERR